MPAAAPELQDLPAMEKKEENGKVEAPAMEKKGIQRSVLVCVLYLL